VPGRHLAAKRTKRPASGERNERWALSAPSAKIERPGKAGRYDFILEGTKGSVCPVGTCAKRKATRRSQPKRAEGAVSARRED